MEIDGVGGGDGAKWACLCGPSGERGQERGLASMPPQSEAVAATEVAVMMGAVIAATAAVKGGRLGGGGGLDRARGASTLPAER